MTWGWFEIALSAVAGFSTGAALHWWNIARRARRRQFVTAVRLNEARRALARVVRELMDTSRKLGLTNERAEELNELAAAYVIISQLDDLRDDPAPHTVR